MYRSSAARNKINQSRTFICLLHHLIFSPMGCLHFKLLDLLGLQISFG